MTHTIFHLCSYAFLHIPDCLYNYYWNIPHVVYWSAAVYIRPTLWSTEYAVLIESDSLNPSLDFALRLNMSVLCGRLQIRLEK